MWALFNKFARKKVINPDNEKAGKLKRVLSTLDLTFLGIGSTLGIGVYVLAGLVAKESAGPAVVLSFLVAALASVLAGLCYAEFGSRVPQAGSAYTYSYVSCGEFIAFVVGWNLIMEYVIGVASVAKGYSEYVDQFFHYQMSNALVRIFPLPGDFLANYFDAFAMSVVLMITVLLTFGVKESSLFNNVFTVLNLGVVLFICVGGAFYADPKNWALRKEDILNVTANITSERIGEGGFAPFGFHGIMKGAATCFYGFVGFDCIATTGEEAKNPQRSIPLSIIFSLLFIFLAYFGISTVLTMMVPYYLQDPKAPLPQAFMAVDFNVGKWVVTIGALFGLSTSLLGAMFPMPRVIYAMASDGVIFKFLAKVHPRFQTPAIATLIAGTFGGLMSALFKLEALIDMMSIGTLTAYTLVAICVLCLRYRKDVDGADDIGEPEPVSSSQSFLGQVFNSHKSTVPTDLSSTYTNWAVFVYCIVTLSFCAIVIFAEEKLLQGDILIVCLTAGFGGAMVLLLISLCCQPVSRVKISFKVPWVPFLPGLSVLANVYLIMKLSGITWIRFSVWMGVGFLIYAICLINGTTDRSYAASVEDRVKRKYSKVSVSGFQNRGFDFLSSDLGNGTATTNKSPEDAAAENLAMDHFSSEDSSVKQNGNRAAGLDGFNGRENALKSKIHKFKGVETETIEKSVDIEDIEEMQQQSTELKH